MGLKDIGWNSLDWINLAQNRDKWRALVKAVLKLRALNAGNFDRLKLTQLPNHESAPCKELLSCVFISESDKILSLCKATTEQTAATKCSRRSVVVVPYGWYSPCFTLYHIRLSLCQTFVTSPHRST